MVSAQSSEAGSLGSDLRAAREASGLTVEQVSAATKIRATLVHDLEADRFESSGGSVYARGHLRSIAVSLGTDPAPLVARFDREDPSGPLPALRIEAVARSGVDRTPASGSPLGVQSGGRVERRGPNWVFAGLGAMALLVVLVVVGSVTGGGSSPAGDALGASPTPSPSRSTTAAPPAPDAVAERPVPTGAELRVRIIGGQSWISVSNAAGRLFEGVLGDGEFKDFKDPTQLKLVVGNAGAVNLVCGGKDVGQAGDRGRVKRFTCSASGLVAG